MSEIHRSKWQNYRNFPRLIFFQSVINFTPHTLDQSLVSLRLVQVWFKFISARVSISDLQYYLNCKHLYRYTSQKVSNLTMCVWKYGTSSLPLFETEPNLTCWAHSSHMTGFWPILIGGLPKSDVWTHSVRTRSSSTRETPHTREFSHQNLSSFS